MIDNDQSTIIEAPEVYKSIPTHSPSRNQRQKKCRLWHLWWTCYGQFYWTNLSEYHIHTKYCKFDHSETIFGPFKKLTFFKAPAKKIRVWAGTHLTRLARRKAKNPKAKAAILAKTIFCPLAHRYPHLEYRLLFFANPQIGDRHATYFSIVCGLTIADFWFWPIFREKSWNNATLTSQSRQSSPLPLLFMPLPHSEQHPAHTTIN